MCPTWFQFQKEKKILHDMLRRSTNAKSDILSQMKGTIIDTSTIHKHGKSFLRYCRTFYFGIIFGWYNSREVRDNTVFCSYA